MPHRLADRAEHLAPNTTAEAEVWLVLSGIAT